MKATRYYSIKLYGLAPFPRFIDSFKRMKDVNHWLTMAKSDGFTHAEIFRETIEQPQIFGVNRELVREVTL